MYNSSDFESGFSLRNCEGKGTLGCLISLILLGAAIFVGVRVGPDYYAYRSFETDVKTEVSRAGANFFEDDTIIKNLLDLARKNEIRLKREEIKVERLAGQVFVKIIYTVPVDVVVYQSTMDFSISASSFIGKL